MWINKVTPYYTDQDRKALAEYEEQIDSYFREHFSILAKIRKAKEAGDEALAISLQAGIGEISAKMKSAETAKDQLEQSIEQRYIDSFAGNTEAILADVREIINAIEHGDFLSWHEKTAPTFKTLAEAKPEKGSSKEERERYKAVKQLTVKGYSTCYSFILFHVRAQLNALAFYQDKDGEAQVIELVREKTGSFYKQPKSAKPVQMINLERSMPQGSAIRGDLLTLPQGPIVDLIYEVLAGIDLDRTKTYNRNKRYDIQDNEKEDKRFISYSTGKTKVSLEINHFSTIMSKSNAKVRKILTKSLMELNRQAMHNGVLTRYEIEFPLRDLVGEGMYSNLDSARAGYYDAGDVFTDIKASGKISKGKNSLEAGGHRVLIPSVDVEHATCRLAVNPGVNWEAILPFFTVLPDFYFKLSGRAADLLHYIFILARQNADKIAQDGSFTISYRAIQNRLNLPDENEIRNTKRDIKDVIDAIVDEISSRYNETVPKENGRYTKRELSLELIEDYDAPIKQYLDEGKLKVSFKGSYAKLFIEIREQTRKKVEAEKKRQERIQDLAQAKALSTKS